MKVINGEPVVILIIEDNPDHAQLVIRSFKNQQVSNQIIHIEDGESAINYLNINNEDYKRPNLILLDLRLPKVDGLEVLKYIKTNETLSDIPVVILTTSEKDADVAKAYKYHANSYLVKPIDFSKFTEMMNTLGFYWICWNKHPFVAK